MIQRLQKACKRRLLLPLLRRLHPEVEVRVRGRRMRIDLRDRVISFLLYLEGEYEAHILSFLSHLDLQGRTCVDIGANIGLHTLALSELVGETGRVFALEPERHNFDLLTRNLRLNGVANVTGVNCAVGEIDGVRNLTLSADNFGDHHLRNGPAGTSGQAVQVIRLDTLLREHGDPSITLIKIDTQGYEAHVLQGMGRVLQRNPDLVLVLEVYPEGLRAVGQTATGLMQSLRDMGFNGYEISEHRLLPIAEPRAYELILHGKSVDCILSRNPQRLEAALRGYLDQAAGGPQREL